MSNFLKQKNVIFLLTSLMSWGPTVNAEQNTPTKQDLYKLQAENIRQQQKVQQQIAQDQLKYENEMANRRDKSNGAQAAAIVGAAVAFATCAMMFAEAKKLEAIDPAKASEMKMKALKECGQGLKTLPTWGKMTRALK